MEKLFPMLVIFLLCSTAVIAGAAAPTSSVIVIGAGMSGISAAKTLDEAGVKDIVILEASSRIGGRMMKTEFAGLTVELGANYLFGGGPVDNPVLDVANDLKLKLWLNDYDNITANTFKQEGGLYPQEEVEVVDNIAVARDEFCSNLSEIISSDTSNDIDISILGAQRLFKQVPKTPLEMVIDYYYNDYEDGEPPKVTSLKHTYPRMEMVDHGDDSLFVYDPRGFEIVPQYFAKQFLRPSLYKDPRLKLNKVVTEINYTDDGVEVTTEDGSKYEAKYVLVSVSIGVLQSDLIQFNPPLPLWKSLAISEYSMTIYTKIFLKFPYAFWPTGPGSEFFLYTHERRGYYPVWQHLEFEHPGSNIIFVTVTTEESRRIEELTDETVQEEIMVVLKTLFGDNIPEPEAILVPRWGKERFYRGSYSNWPARYSEKQHDQLAAPVGPIHFTGEHLHKRYIAYVTGAYFAGIDSANEILKSLKNSTGKESGEHLPY